MELTEFLLARIEEDEARAGGVHTAADDDLAVCVCGYPARVLADCEAKRRIVELRETAAYHVEQFAAAADDPFRIVYTTSLSTYDAVLRSLALPFVDHPDYRGEWRS